MPSGSLDSPTGEVLLALLCGEMDPSSQYEGEGKGSDNKFGWAMQRPVKAILCNIIRLCVVKCIKSAIMRASDCVIPWGEAG